jgi:hypothetical protein
MASLGVLQHTLPYNHEYTTKYTQYHGIPRKALMYIKIILNFYTFEKERIPLTVRHTCFKSCNTDLCPKLIEF